MSVKPQVVVDVMGGDNAPDVVVEGIRSACAQDPDVRIIATGTSEALKPLAGLEQVRCVEASEVIGMDEHPTQAIRAKKDSSIVVGCRLVKEGEADGFFSAGSTGAAMAAATLGIGRIKGVKRPAIATVLPGVNGPVVLLDVGANADCTPEYLVQFARMGRAYARAVLGISQPGVGLLNIGEEETKGSQFAQECFTALTAHEPHFIGNIEGTDILRGDTTVVVTDGFTGNVALKCIEGASKVILSQVKGTLTSSVFAKICVAPLAGKMRTLKKSMDPDQFGGAPLLGIKGVVVIGHGSSSAHAIACGIAATARAVRNDLTNKISDALD
ncbi:MAG: phosphate acyltransferase PlsX [Coriobacteriia bacterium]|nr:phosphate acyltransferase PlsX [Coriobacteriia bacterium]